MKVIVFDTESNGLFDFSKPADADGQPRLAHFAALPIDTDVPDWEKNLEGLTMVERYVLPDGWAMTTEATAVNGLTDAFLSEHGVPIGQVLDIYDQFIRGGYVVAAFNVQHDAKIMRAEFRHAGRDDLFEQTPNTCLMRACRGMDIKKLNGKKGQPGLVDVCAHLGIVNSAPHKANGDTMSAAHIFAWLFTTGRLIEPAVHYAKSHPGKVEVAQNDMNF